MIKPNLDFPAMSYALMFDEDKFAGVLKQQMQARYFTLYALDRERDSVNQIIIQ